MTDQKVREETAVVTGSSTGIGFETSLALTRNGFFTYATMRNLEKRGPEHLRDIAKNENLPLEVIQLDVDNDKSVSEAIGRILGEKGRIDIVINNAGRSEERRVGKECRSRWSPYH